MTPLTCTIKRVVLVGVQADHLANGPHVVSQHDALSLHHEEVCVGWRKDQEREEPVKALSIRRGDNRQRLRRGGDESREHRIGGGL